MSLPNVLFEKSGRWYKRLTCKLIGHIYLPDKQSLSDYDGDTIVGMARYSICDRCNIHIKTEYKHV